MEKDQINNVQSKNDKTANGEKEANIITPQISNLNESPENARVPVVLCQDVYKIYKQGSNEVFALKGLNLTLNPGELVVIEGPSGSGKTTLLNVIAGLERATAGVVNLKGFDMTRLKEEQILHLIQNEIGIVFQFFNLLPNLTVYGNIELPMVIAKKPRKEQIKRIAELLTQLGLEKRSFARPYTLSGGERQRVAIAMAFANNPGLILADEPTGNLDSVNAKKILEIFRNFNENNTDKAILIVTHNPIFREIANRTLILKDGQIVQEISRQQFEIDKKFQDTILQKLKSRLIQNSTGVQTGNIEFFLQTTFLSEIIRDLESDEQKIKENTSQDRVNSNTDSNSGKSNPEKKEP